MSAELYLIRHAESVLNHSNDVIIGRSNHIDLSPKGIEQAEILGRFLQQQEVVPDYVYSSPALRARKTAEISLATMGISRPIIENDLIQERDQGLWEGKPKERVLSEDVLAELEIQGRQYRPPEGESDIESARRMYAWIDSYVSTDPNTVTFVYSHRNVIMGVISSIMNLTSRQAYETKCENTSVTRLQHDGIWQLSEIARTPTLELEAAR